MASRSLINMSLDALIVNDIAAELGVDPAFIEKDWYSVQVLRALASYQSDTICTIFSGGTSLSKGYGMLQRFSEDLDFRCGYLVEGSSHQYRKVRSAYRANIIEVLQSLDYVGLNEDEIDIASNYIKFPLAYSRQTSLHSALRPHLELEFSFTPTQLSPELRPLQSLVSQFLGEDPETEILCLAPVETAADKLSALTWRVLKRDRSLPNDDPAMIRHLQDLCALSSSISADFDLFKLTALSSFEEDQKTSKRSTSQGLRRSMEMALTELQRDELYKKEYRQFVDGMSYANDADKIRFEVALSTFESLIVLFE